MYSSKSYLLIITMLVFCSVFVRDSFSLTLPKSELVERALKVVPEKPIQAIYSSGPFELSSQSFTEPGEDWKLFFQGSPVSLLNTDAAEPFRKFFSTCPIAEAFEVIDRLTPLFPSEEEKKEQSEALDSLKNKTAAERTVLMPRLLGRKPDASPVHQTIEFIQLSLESSQIAKLRTILTKYCRHFARVGALELYEARPNFYCLDSSGLLLVSNKAELLRDTAARLAAGMTTLQVTPTDTDDWALVDRKARYWAFHHCWVRDQEIPEVLQHIYNAFHHNLDVDPIKNQDYGAKGIGVSVSNEGVMTLRYKSSNLLARNDFVNSIKSMVAPANVFADSSIWSETACVAVDLKQPFEKRNLFRWIKRQFGRLVRW